jgi:alkylated DNA repair dioxygenase AlkB
VSVHRSALSSDLVADAFSSLEREIEWRQDHIVMFGRRSPVPRLTAWFGDPGFDYTYSGISMSASPWTPTLEKIREEVSTLADRRFNTVLANFYRDGSDGVAWHADDEKELGDEPMIASVSLGGSRRFQFRRVDDPSEKREIELRNGDVVIMSGLTQHLWLHQIPKTSKQVEPRINLTFRNIIR